MLRFYSCLLVICLAANLVEGKDENSKKLIAGKSVPADAKLSRGDKLVAVYEKKNYLVDVREVKSNKKLRIRWIETGENTDDVAPNELYYIGDATPTRRSRTSPLPEAYRALDKNGDGQIGLYEWDRAKYAEFKRLDKNRDGLLTPQELGAPSTPTVAAVITGAPAKEADPVESKELPNPGNLATYSDKKDMSFVFSVTGKIGGAVWGSQSYAVESDLAAVAVHAGVLKEGATGPVTVTITGPVDRFTGSVMNGVTSVDRQEAGPGFTVK